MSLAGWIALGVCLWTTAAFALTASRAGVRGGAGDRRSLVSNAGEAAFGLALGRAFIPWDVIPPLVWAVPAAMAAWGLLAAARSWRDLPGVSGDRKRIRLALTSGGVLLKAALVVAIV